MKFAQQKRRTRHCCLDGGESFETDDPRDRTLCSIYLVRKGLQPAQVRHASRCSPWLEKAHSSQRLHPTPPRGQLRTQLGQRTEAATTPRSGPQKDILAIAFWRLLFQIDWPQWE